MKLDTFLDKILDDIMTPEGLDRVKQIIQEDLKSNRYNYDTTKVECQVFDEVNNFNPRVEISNETYSDGEIIFIDYHLDEKNILRR